MCQSGGEACIKRCHQRGIRCIVEHVDVDVGRREFSATKRRAAAKVSNSGSRQAGDDQREAVVANRRHSKSLAWTEHHVCLRDYRTCHLPHQRSVLYEDQNTATC